jgi:hypothetical protein
VRLSDARESSAADLAEAAAPVKRDADERCRRRDEAGEHGSHESNGHGLRARQSDQREHSRGRALVDTGVAGRMGAVLASPVTIR